MAKRQQPDGFDLSLADHQNSSHYFEEVDGSHHLWSELSAEGKLAYLAGDAALYDVPFERFQAAVSEILGEVEPAIREEAALRLALRNEKELHEVARLLPPDERLEGTPLPERVQEALAEAETRPAAESSLLQQLAAAFQQFVGEFTGAGPKDIYRQMLAERTAAAGLEQSKDKDNGIER